MRPSKTSQEIKVEHLSENKSAEDVLRHNYGDTNEINLLFTALARAAGFNAWVVQVVDRTSAAFEPKVLDASQLNAMVVLIRLEGKDLYFDPATRFCPYGLLPWFESDTGGIKWDKAGAGVFWIPPLTSESSAFERTAELHLTPDGGLEGSVELVLRGQKALDMRLSGLDEDDTGRRKLAEDEVKELAPPSATIEFDTVTGWQESEQPLRIRCRLYAPRFATVTHERMLLPVAIFQANQMNSLHHGSRVQPVYFQHCYHSTDKITISLPTGYRVEALPSAAEDNTTFAAFSAKSTAQGDRLVFERRWELRGYYFPVQYYGSLWAHFEKMRQSDAKNLVLHRVDPAQNH